MGKKNLSAIMAVVRQRLRDEATLGELEWEEGELNLLANECLVEISECSPYQVKETLTTEAGSRDLDISEITDLLYIDVIEYPVGNTPKSMRNCTIFGDTLTMEIDGSPSADENVYLYCAKTHQLTEDESTLNPKEERILILGVTGHAAINKSRTLINKVNIGGARAPAELQAWGYAQITLYRQGLLEITKSRIYIDYPK